MRSLLWACGIVMACIIYRLARKMYVSEPNKWLKESVPFGVLVIFTVTYMDWVDHY